MLKGALRICCSKWECLDRGKIKSFGAIVLVEEEEDLFSSSPFFPP